MPRLDQPCNCAKDKTSPRPVKIRAAGLTPRPAAQPDNKAGAS